MQEHVQAGRVAAAHLEAVDRRQRDLHRGEDVDCGVTEVGPREIGDRTRRAQPIPAHRPDRIAQAHERGVHGLDLTRGADQLIEGPVDAAGRGLDRLHLVFDRDGEAGVAEQRTDARRALEQRVDGLDRLGRGVDRDGQRREIEGAVEVGRRALERVDDDPTVRRHPGRGPADDHHDPTHRRARLCRGREQSAGKRARRERGPVGGPAGRVGLELDDPSRRVPEPIDIARRKDEAEPVVGHPPAHITRR